MEFNVQHSISSTYVHIENADIFSDELYRNVTIEKLQQSYPTRLFTTGKAARIKLDWYWWGRVSSKEWMIYGRRWCRWKEVQVRGR